MLSAAVGKRTCPRCRAEWDATAAFCPNDGAALDTPSSPDVDPYIGTVIRDDIEIRSVAGAGAMGRVYRAHQRGIDRDVAVKILHRELSGNTSLVQRFHREAKIASKLQHPHVVDVYMAGQLADGALYIAMEFLDGLSLAAAMSDPIGLERALSIILQVCDAVGAGHARGIVHRDLKPENVMLVQRADTRDFVKVLDFGIAKVSLGEQSMETAAGLIFGTARYISPEGAQGAAVGPAGDVYSIAVILYQLLSGKTPFDSEAPVGLLVKHIHDDPPPLRSLAPHVPEPIAKVVMDNLAKEPDARAPNAKAFGTALAAAAKDAEVSLSDVGVVARMSMVDVRDASSARPVDASSPRALEDSSPRTIGLDPTIDDMPAPRMPTPMPAPVPVVVREEPPVSKRPRRSVGIVVVLAFLVGVATSALALQMWIDRPNREHAAFVKRAHRALAHGNYVDPPGDNVRDLVKEGLERWPDDAELGKIQSDAAHELATRAMAARSGGDVAGARDLARAAQELDPTDGTARLLLAQYEDELSGTGGALGGPRVALEVPAAAVRAGARTELSARITNGADVSGAQFVVTGPGLAKDGVTLPAGSGPLFRAAFTPPRAGRYAVEFEANVQGATVRADRTIEVK